VGGTIQIVEERIGAIASWSQRIKGKHAEMVAVKYFKSRKLIIADKFGWERSPEGERCRSSQ
jgi:hypothetical protein